jgi:hypothetical protein
VQIKQAELFWDVGANRFKSKKKRNNICRGDEIWIDGKNINLIFKLLLSKLKN